MAYIYAIFYTREKIMKKPQSSKYIVSLRGVRWTTWQSLIVLLTFIINTFSPIPSVYSQEYFLPAPGVMVHLSPPLDPPILKGIKINPNNPFRFEFILDKGDNSLPLRGEGQGGGNQEQLKEEATKLIKYFLASLTIPEKDLWVNLSPYEKNRIIPSSFGLTEMGRDLLAEDYMLKQITASLIYPEDTIGKKFWKRIYSIAAQKYGTTNIPINTFNKVWIVPQKAVVYENAKAGTAYVVESKLKVMLEQDYLSLEKHSSVISPSLAKEGVRGSFAELNALGSQITREIVIPELTREVNENKNFARLRQVYNSLILATWYKQKIKDSILAQVYADKNKVAGVNIDDPKEKERIYRQYLRAFKKGVYNYIKEDMDPMTQEMIPRKYFSGGLKMGLVIDGMMKGTNLEVSTLDVVHAIDASQLSSDNALEVDADFSPSDGMMKTQRDMASISTPAEIINSLNEIKQVNWFEQHGVKLSSVNEHFRFFEDNHRLAYHFDPTNPDPSLRFINLQSGRIYEHAFKLRSSNHFMPIFSSDGRYFAVEISGRNQIYEMTNDGPKFIKETSTKGDNFSFSKNNKCFIFVEGRGTDPNDKRIKVIFVEPSDERDLDYQGTGEVSENGEWIVLDPMGSPLRINLSTDERVRFPMGNRGSHITQYRTLNDGRIVAVAPEGTSLLVADDASKPNDYKSILINENGQFPMKGLEIHETSKTAVIWGNRKLIVFDLKTLKIIKDIPLDPKGQDVIAKVIFSDDGNKIITVPHDFSNSSPMLINLSIGGVRSLGINADTYQSVRFMKNTRFIYLKSYRGGVNNERVYDVKAMGNVMLGQSLAVSPDGRYAAEFLRDNPLDRIRLDPQKDILRILDSSTGRVVLVPGVAVGELHFSQDGQQIYVKGSGYYDNSSVRALSVEEIFNNEGIKFLQEKWDADSGNVIELISRADMLKSYESLMSIIQRMKKYEPKKEDRTILSDLFGNGFNEYTLKLYQDGYVTRAMEAGMTEEEALRLILMKLPLVWRNKQKELASCFTQLLNLGWSFKEASDLLNKSFFVENLPSVQSLFKALPDFTINGLSNKQVRKLAEICMLGGDGFSMLTNFKIIIEDPAWTDEQRQKFVDILIKRFNPSFVATAIVAAIQEGIELLGPERMLRFLDSRDEKRQLEDIVLNVSHQSIFSGIKNFRDKLTDKQKERFLTNVIDQTAAQKGVDSNGEGSHRQLDDVIEKLNSFIAKNPDGTWDIALQKAVQSDPMALKLYTELFKLEGGIPFCLTNFNQFRRLAVLVNLLYLPELTQAIVKYNDGTDKGAKLYQYFYGLLTHAQMKDFEALKKMILFPDQFLALGDKQATLKLFQALNPSNLTNLEKDSLIDISAKDLIEAMILGKLDDAQTLYESRTEIGVDEIDPHLNGPGVLQGTALFNYLLTNGYVGKNELKGIIQKTLQAESMRLYRENDIEGKRKVGSIQAIINTQDFEKALVSIGGIDFNLNNLFNMSMLKQNGLALTKYTIRIIPKSDHQAIMTGSEAPSCMSFGTGKNNDYMFNPNVSILALTRKMLNNDGQPIDRIVATSVLTVDREIPKNFADFSESFITSSAAGGSSKISLLKFFGNNFINEISTKGTIAIDNIEAAPNTIARNEGAVQFQDLVEAAYRKFFKEYFAKHQYTRQGRPLVIDKVVMGFAHGDIQLKGDRIPNNYMPQSFITYTDKRNKEVIEVKIDSEPLAVPLSDLNGIRKLTPENILDIGAIEEMAFEKQSVKQELEEIQVETTAAMYNEKINQRPEEKPKENHRKNLSFGYFEKGRLRGYARAYVGFDRETQKEVIYVSDLAVADKKSRAAYKVLDALFDSIRETARNFGADYGVKDLKVVFEATSDENGSYRLFRPFAGDSEAIIKKKEQRLQSKGLKVVQDEPLNDGIGRRQVVMSVDESMFGKNPVKSPDVAMDAQGIQDLSKWIHDQRKRYNGRNNLLLTTALRSSGLSEKDIEYWAKRFILVDDAAYKDKFGFPLDEKSTASRIVETFGGAYIVLSQDYGSLKAPENREAKADIRRLLTLIALTMEGADWETANEYSLDAKEDSLVGRVFDILKYVNIYKKKLNEFVQNKVEEDIKELFNRDDPSFDITHLMGPFAKSFSSYLIEGGTEGYGRKWGMNIFDLNAIRAHFSSLVDENIDFSRKKWADWLNAKFSAYFIGEESNIKPEQILQLKNDDTNGNGSFVLQELGVNARRAPSFFSSADFQGTLTHEYFHIRYPGFTQAKFLNEAITELLTQKILGLERETGYQERVQVLKRILGIDRTGQAEEILIDCYKKGDLLLLKSKFSELYKGDVLFNLLMNLDLFEYEGKEVSGYMLSNDMEDYLRELSYFQKIRINYLSKSETTTRGIEEIMTRLNLLRNERIYLLSNREDFVNKSLEFSSINNNVFSHFQVLGRVSSRDGAMNASIVNHISMLAVSAAVASGILSPSSSFFADLLTDAQQKAVIKADANALGFVRGQDMPSEQFLRMGMPATQMKAERDLLGKLFGEDALRASLQNYVYPLLGLIEAMKGVSLSDYETMVRKVQEVTDIEHQSVPFDPDQQRLLLGTVNKIGMGNFLKIMDVLQNPDPTGKIPRTAVISFDNNFFEMLENATNLGVDNFAGIIHDSPYLLDTKGVLAGAYVDESVAKIKALGNPGKYLKGTDPYWKLKSNLLLNEFCLHAYALEGANLGHGQVMSPAEFNFNLNFMLGRPRFSAKEGNNADAENLRFGIPLFQSITNAQGEYVVFHEVGHLMGLHEGELNLNVREFKADANALSASQAIGLANGADMIKYFSPTGDDKDHNQHNWRIPAQEMFSQYGNSISWSQVAVASQKMVNGDAVSKPPANPTSYVTYPKTFFDKLGKLFPYFKNVSTYFNDHSFINHAKAPGGIDLTRANQYLQIKTSSSADKNGGIKFHLNAAIMAQLRNAPGFVPVIINMQPIKNIAAFLGINK